MCCPICQLKPESNRKYYKANNENQTNSRYLVRSATPDNSMSLTTFVESRPMSSYLFAFVVSDFSKLSLGDNYTAYAQPSVINTTQYALDFTQEAISYLGTFFKRSYQLPKLDIVAVDDFLMGAMENWGLITYK